MGLEQVGAARARQAISLGHPRETLNYTVFQVPRRGALWRRGLAHTLLEAGGMICLAVCALAPIEIQDKVLMHHWT